MSKSYIKQLIEKYHNSKFNQRVGSGLLALATTATLLTSCTDSTINPFDTGDTTTESVGITNPNNGGISAPGTYSATFSQTYYNAYENWKNIWFNKQISLSGKSGFQLKCAPFTFLQEQGVVDSDEFGYFYAIGNEDYTNNNCIQTKAFVDENTKENDLYLLVQYVSTPLAEKGANEDTFVSTWMLKYTLDADCYKDLLALNSDFKINLFIQQIDEEYEPQIISHSLIKYDLINRLQIFKDISKTNNQSILKSIDGVNNYVEDVDIDNTSITVNFTPKDDYGKIYSYTYKLKETPNWYDALENVTPQGYVENLTNEEIMIKRNTFLGDALWKCDVVVLPLIPSKEQKASAEVKYDFSALEVGVTSVEDAFENYENGMIQFHQVNKLTKNHSESEEYSK